jgi:hypothetical protein
MRLVLALALLSASAISQQFLVVPAEASNADGNASAWLPACGRGGTSQVVIAASHLQGLLGRTLVGLSFRRDGSWLQALPQSAGQLTVRIGASTRDPVDAAPDLATNLPSPTEVFSGTLSIPAMPATQGYIGWVSPHTVDITFTRSFTYQGGPLALEFSASLTTTPTFFPIDGIAEDLTLDAPEIGVACGPRAASLRRTAARSGSGFAPGGTSQLLYSGTPGNNAFAFFGVALLPQPIDLSVLGARGCHWYVDAFTALGSPIAAHGIPIFDPLAAVNLQVPGTAAMLGGQLVVQWLEFGPGTLASSQAMILPIGNQLGSLGMAQLERLSDGSVHVAPACGPVIGFRYL